MTVAILYCDPRGPYPKLVGPEFCWDEQRDARTYAGPWPVVAHPPCGPWGRLFRFCTRQDATLGPIAVQQVREFGGVLEHPEWSKLWPHCGLPEPGALPDSFGGASIAVEQVSWGHVASKKTWLYCVGCRSLDGYRTGGVATATVSTTRRRGEHLPEMRKSQRHITPIAFAEWLISLAEQANARTGAA